MAAEELQEQGYEAEAIEVDVTNPRTQQPAYDYLEKKYGRLDILINNAAVWIESATSSSPFPEANRTTTLSSEILRETFETNFSAPLL